MSKTEAISVRVPQDLKDAVARAAMEDGRSIASYVERLLTAHLTEKGYLKR